MRNVWIGLVIGGLTGAAVGVSLDLGEAAGRRATEAAETARKALQHHGADIAEHAVDRARSKAHG